MMNEIPYALYVMNDVSQNELTELPTSVEIVPYKAISINDIQYSSIHMPKHPYK